MRLLLNIALLLAFVLIPAVLSANVDLDKLDLVIAPGIAFDKNGHRIGYGYGYYDRFLGSLPEVVLRVGLACARQLVPEVPVDPWDVPVHALATEEAADAAVALAQPDLAAAQSDLAEAQSGPSSADIASADASVTAAQQALEAANLKLAELTEGATENELATAQENVEMATAALETANAKLAELNEGPTQSESAKAQDSTLSPLGISFRQESAAGSSA